MEYKNIPGTDYKISNCGQVLGIYGALRKPFNTRAGYASVSLKTIRGWHNYAIHRLVWMAWVGPIPKGIWINHKDGNKLNNSIDNLELTTPSENHIHAYQILKRNRASGLQVHTAKLSPKQIEDIKFLSSRGHSQRELARLFKVSQPAIQLQLSKCQRLTSTGRYGLGKDSA